MGGSAMLGAVQKREESEDGLGLLEPHGFPEADMGELSGSGERLSDVASVESLAKSSVSRALRGHEHMFARGTCLSTISGASGATGLRPTPAAAGARPRPSGLGRLIPLRPCKDSVRGPDWLRRIPVPA